MPFWSRLFGGKPAGETLPAEEHRGFRITPKPIPEGSRFRVAARIEKEVDGAPRVHDLIRADTTATLEEARSLSLLKARQMIDEQGERLFG
ncbi:HlyU family transcriptional regulator [Rubellimicrobium sp. CFH 75288]|uniref:HlyU family transcriptional regulator n=1 Tax=Rubellimicrobium sp. CFH 75288 TaxID=2697034 RepID=UPI001412D76A|nr:HlyU family transcriptional regulator [Rubellimicrobium sp. CFH 75288]NAZ36525.1 hypothetical protein [Rubellimicrobium sp. CFH 75288]